MDLKYVLTYFFLENLMLRKTTFLSILSKRELFLLGPIETESTISPESSRLLLESHALAQTPDLSLTWQRPPPTMNSGQRGFSAPSGALGLLYSCSRLTFLNPLPTFFISMPCIPIH